MVDEIVDTFLAGYALRAGSGTRVPRTLLRLFELEKAAYAVGYESRFRSDRLPIPLGVIRRLVGLPRQP